MSERDTQSRDEGQSAEKQQAAVYRSLLARHPEFSPDAFAFVHASIGYTAARKGEQGHVSGADVAEGTCDLAIEQFGLMARMRLESWGMKSSDDIGRVVFALCDAGLLRRRDEDSPEDFQGLFTFEERFIDREWKKPALAEPKPWERKLGQGFRA